MLNKQITVVTNNHLVKEFIRESYRNIEVIFADDTIQELITVCERLFMSQGYSLASDPMGGRLARPFPFLSVILFDHVKATTDYDWLRLADYRELDSQRTDIYRDYSNEFLSDYRILDLSLTESALEKLMR